MKFKTILAVALGALAFPTFAEDDSIDGGESFHSTDDVFSSGFTISSASRLKTSRAETPASVTVLTDEDLKRLGVKQLVEVFQYVAGFGINYYSGSSIAAEYHGSNSLIPRRMTVIIDEVPIYYRAAYAKVDWTTLPIAIEEVARIEIVRGPNVATYGANAFLAVINITTKKPENSDKFYVSHTRGDVDTENATLMYNNHLTDNTQFSFISNYVSHSGFDTNEVGNERHDDLRHSSNKIRLYHELSDTKQNYVDVSLAHAMTKIQNEFVHPTQITFPDNYVEDFYFTTKLNYELSSDHHTKWKLGVALNDRKEGWTSIVPTVAFLPELRVLYNIDANCANEFLAGNIAETCGDEGMAAIGDIMAVFASDPNIFDPIQVSADQDLSENQIDLEMANTYTIDSNNRFVYGFGWKHVEFESQTYMQGSETLNQKRVFGNYEHTNGDFILNLGGMYESDDYVNSLSPRVALNYILNDTSSFRAIASKAHRNPDIYEQAIEWNYTVYDLSYNPVWNEGSDTLNFYIDAYGTGNLQPEEILSSEIGYLYYDRGAGISFDLRIYYDKLDSLISEKLQYRDFNPTNSNSGTHKGFEVEYKYSNNDDLNVLASVSYMDNESTNIYELSLTRNWLVNGYVDYRFAENFAINFNFAHGSKIEGQIHERNVSTLPDDQREGVEKPTGGFSRVGVNLQSTFEVGEKTMEVSLSAQHSIDSNPWTSVFNNYDDRTRLFLRASLAF